MYGGKDISQATKAHRGSSSTVVFIINVSGRVLISRSIDWLRWIVSFQLRYKWLPGSTIWTLFYKNTLNGLELVHKPLHIWETYPPKWFTFVKTNDVSTVVNAGLINGMKRYDSYSCYSLFEFVAPDSFPNLEFISAFLKIIVLYYFQGDYILISPRSLHNRSCPIYQGSDSSHVPFLDIISQNQVHPCQERFSSVCVTYSKVTV